MASKIDVEAKKLLEAGAHFGHKTSRWHPAMRPFIHSKRGDTHIIDLTQTADRLEVALEAMTDVVAKGGQVLLVSTKRQARDAILELAEATAMPVVVNRWLGGMLTNQNTIGGRVKHLKKLEERMASGELKKEIIHTLKMYHCQLSKMCIHCIVTEWVIVASTLEVCMLGPRSKSKRFNANDDESSHR